MIVVIYCVQVCVLVLFCGASGQHDDDFGPPRYDRVASTGEILLLLFLSWTSRRLAIADLHHHFACPGMPLFIIATVSIIYIRFFFVVVFITGW